MAKKENKNRGRGAKNLLRNNILSIFRADPIRLFNYKQISAKLTIKDKSGRDLVNTLIAELLQEETLLEVRPGKFKLNAAWAREQQDFSNTITGSVDMKNTGKAYISPEDGSDDIFIAPNNTDHALHGDTVKVQLFPKRKDKKPEGQIVEIVKRAKEQFVGVIEISKKFAFLIPDSRNMPVDIFIPLEDLKGAKSGQKVVARITEWPKHSKNPFGEITNVLGNPGEHNVEMQSILAEHDFPLSFPAQVEREAEKIPSKIPDEEYKKRRDFRDIWTITIDPEDAKDFDDALSLKKLKSGNWEVGVHIADVSYYVKPGTQLDDEAYKRRGGLCAGGHGLRALRAGASGADCPRGRRGGGAGRGRPGGRLSGGRERAPPLRPGALHGARPDPLRAGRRGRGGGHVGGRGPRVPRGALRRALRAGGRPPAGERRLPPPPQQRALHHRRLPHLPVRAAGPRPLRAAARRHPSARTRGDGQPAGRPVAPRRAGLGRGARPPARQAAPVRETRGPPRAQDGPSDRARGQRGGGAGRGAGDPGPAARACPPGGRRRRPRGGVTSGLTDGPRPARVARHRPRPRR